MASVSSTPVEFAFGIVVSDSGKGFHREAGQGSNRHGTLGRLRWAWFESRVLNTSLKDGIELVSDFLVEAMDVKSRRRAAGWGHWEMRDRNGEGDGNPVGEVVRELAETVIVDGAYAHESVWVMEWGCEGVVNNSVVVFATLASMVVRKSWIKG